LRIFYGDPQSQEKSPFIKNRQNQVLYHTEGFQRNSIADPLLPEISVEKGLFTPEMPNASGSLKT